MKQTNKKYTLSIILTTAIIAFITASSYFPIYHILEKEAYQDIQNETIPEQSDQLLIPLYTQAIMNQKEISPFEILVNKNLLDQNIDQEALNYTLNKQTTTTWNTWFKEHHSQLEYSVILENDQTKEYTNKIQLRNKTKKDYLWYAHFIFDETGKATLKDHSNNIIKYDYENRLNQAQLSYLLQYNNYSSNNLYELFQANPMDEKDQEILTLPKAYQSIKNADMMIAVPKKVLLSDPIFFHHSSNNIHVVTYIFMGLIFMGLIAITSFISLFIPTKYIKQASGLQVTQNISIEYYLFITFIPYFAILFGINLLDSFNYLNELTNGLRTLIITGSLIAIFFATWFLLLYSFILIQHIKQIKELGFSGYLKQKSFIIRAIYHKYHQILSIDLHDKAIYYLTIGIVINTLFPIFLRLTGLDNSTKVWLLWILVYNSLLFYFGIKSYKRMKQNYDDMRAALQEIEKGNFNNQPTTDLGIYQNMNDSIQAIRIGFKQAVEEEVKSQKMKTELITNVSHDLKTPLTTIISYLDLLKNSDASLEEKETYLNTLDVNVTRLKHLIEDLFEVSKASSGNVTLNCTKINVSELIDQLLFEYQEAFQQKHLDIRYSCINEQAYAWLDPQKAYRIFANLLGNISKYAMSHSRVYIELDVDHQIKITFKNISENEIHFQSDEIIERFTRGDSSRNSEGSGLGLSIVQSFIQLQGGTFQVEVDGDLFKAIITLPIYQEPK